MELSYVCNQEPCGHMNRDGGAAHSQNSAGGPFASVLAGKSQFSWIDSLKTKGDVTASQSHQGPNVLVFKPHGNYIECSPFTDGTSIPLKRHIKDARR